MCLTTCVRVSEYVCVDVMCVMQKCGCCCMCLRHCYPLLSTPISYDILLKCEIIFGHGMVTLHGKLVWLAGWLTGWLPDTSNVKKLKQGIGQHHTNASNRIKMLCNIQNKTKGNNNNYNNDYSCCCSYAAATAAFS